MALALLALFPFAGATFYTELVTKVMILAIFAMSLDLLVGYTGLVSFGHAAFFGIGAYTLGLVAPKYDAANLWLTLPAAMLAAGLAALVVGVFVVRAKGIYFIMVTLAFAQMFYFVFHDTKFGGGSDGISMNFKPVASIGGFTPFDLANATHSYYFVFVAMLLVFVFLRVLLRSSFGRALAGHPQQRAADALAWLPRLPLQARQLHPRRRARRPRRLPVGDAIRFRESRDHLVAPIRERAVDADPRRPGQPLRRELSGHSPSWRCRSSTSRSRRTGSCCSGQRSFCSSYSFRAGSQASVACFKRTLVGDADDE